MANRRGDIGNHLHMHFCPVRPGWIGTGGAASGADSRTPTLARPGAVIGVCGTADGRSAKALSVAVRRVRSENISRLINGWRIAHAAERLRSSVSVTLDAGFKSNFNRKFLRMIGQAPTD